MNRLSLLFVVLISSALQVNAQTSENSAAQNSSLVTIQSAAPEVSVVTKTEPKQEESLQFFGDFRLRHQSETASPKQQRTLQRLQARFGFNSLIQEDLKFTFRLMTGSSANSGNQTLGDEKAPGMPRRTIGLDQAYFEYKPVPILSLYGGKMVQPFSFAGKNQLLLDRDITLEGWAFKYNQAIAENVNLFSQAGAFWIRENYDSQFGEDQTDNFLNGLQLGVQWEPQDWTVKAGVGFFAFTDLRDNPPGNITAGSTGNGNTLDINGNYPTNFDLEEVFVEVKRKMGAVDVTLFGESLENKDVATLNRAHIVGILASYKAWSFSGSQQLVEKDAVVGAFTDSDFGGGGTSTGGSVWALGYKVSKKIQLQYTLYKNETAIDLIPMKYDRSHLDLSMTF